MSGGPATIGKRRPARRRLARIALTLVAVFAVLLTTGVVYQAVARERDESRFPPPGQLVDVGGFHLHLNAMGEAANRPTVILEQEPNITIRTCTTLAAVHGEGRLEAITLRSPDALIDEQADGVFVMIGAQPHTRWLPQTIARDGAGYILTGTDIPPKLWSEERPPFPHETSLAGVFAVGDVRAGSLKRVASAVGDGSVCIQQIHQYLSLTRHPGAMHETETA